MKLLLTGAGGQLGSEWQQHFTGNKKTSEIELIPCSSSRLDITNEHNIEKTLASESPDILINCAAYTAVDAAEKNYENARQINTTAVRSLASLCKEYDVKLVHYSTDYVFAGRKSDQNKLPHGYPEDYTTEPVNRYGQTKLDGENEIRTSGCKHLILRLSWLCGAYGDNFVTTMLKLADSRKELKVVDDQTASPTFAADVVAKSMQLINQQKEGTYHVTCSGIISWYDFAREIFKTVGKNIEINAVPSSEFETEAKRPHFSKLDTSKVKAVEGIEIKDWKKELKKMMAHIE